MRKVQILMNKPICLGSSILYLSKTVMYKFWYDYVKPKYGENAKCSSVNTDSLIVHVKTDLELHRSLPKGKNKKVIELMKDK